MEADEAASDPLDYVRSLGPIECGHEAAKHFAFEKGYRNLNHGAYGTYPVEVRSVFRHFQEATESAPDRFVRYEYRTHRLNDNRAVIAKYINAPTETCVYVPNATTAYDTIVRNLVYQRGDVVICFAMIYTSFEYTLQYLAETLPLEIEKIEYTLPVSDEWLSDNFSRTVKELRSRGKTPRLAIFDTITSTPGVRMPFERLTELCRSLGVLSLIDGAHGVGHIPLDMTSLDPDFFTSNCHKWLYVPRSCSVLFVPLRNQHLIRATMPTGFAFVPAKERGRKSYAEGQGDFIANFGSVGTLDDNSCLCVEAGIEWRKKLVWNGEEGEEAAMSYMRDLAYKGGQRLVSILGTEILDNEEKSLTQCNFTNIRLPLSVTDFVDVVTSPLVGSEIAAWVMKTMIVEHRVALFVIYYGNAWWARLSSQVYLTLEDYEAAGEALKAVCERVPLGAWGS